jgi:hypothetical protein
MDFAGTPIWNEIRTRTTSQRRLRRRGRRKKKEEERRRKKKKKEEEEEEEERRKKKKKNQRLFSLPSESETAPVFLLFLDCVHQLLAQHPRAFEFGEDLLVAAMDAALSGRFGTFL